MSICTVHKRSTKLCQFAPTHWVEKYLRKTVQRKGGKRFSTGKRTHIPQTRQDKEAQCYQTRNATLTEEHNTERYEGKNVSPLAWHKLILSEKNKNKNKKHLQTFTFQFPLTPKHPEPLSHLEQTNFLSRLVTKYCRAKKNTMSCDKLELT